MLSSALACALSTLAPCAELGALGEPALLLSARNSNDFCVLRRAIKWRPSCLASEVIQNMTEALLINKWLAPSPFALLSDHDEQGQK